MAFTVSGTFAIGGAAGSFRVSRSADSEITHGGDTAITLAAAKPGSLTTRTGNTEGVITLTAGHGLSSGTHDVYWSGGERHGVTTVIDTNACTISAGSGDNLPDQDTAVFVAVRTAIDTDFDGDNVVAIILNASARAGVEIAQDDDTNILNVPLAANEPYYWVDDTPTDNPLASADVGLMYASAGSATAATLQIGIAYTSVS